jgi:hypothetical protein
MPIRSREICEPVAPALLAALRAQLEDGERLAWAASPQAATPAPEAPGAGKLEMAAILIGGYATLGACVMAVEQRRCSWLLVPAALLAVGVAAYLIARWLKARAHAARAGTVYGFSTRRAWVVQTYPKLHVEALALEAITDVSVIDREAEWPSLQLHAPSRMIFEHIPEPDRARAQLLRMMRDPKAAEQEMAAAETYAAQMRQLMVRSVPSAQRSGR